MFFFVICLPDVLFFEKKYIYVIFETYTMIGPYRKKVLDARENKSGTCAGGVGALMTLL